MENEIRFSYFFQIIEIFIGCLLLVIMVFYCLLCDTTVTIKWLTNIIQNLCNIINYSLSLSIIASMNHLYRSQVEIRISY